MEFYPGESMYLRPADGYVPVTLLRKDGDRWVVCFNEGGGMCAHESRLYQDPNGERPEWYFNQPLGWYDDYDNARYDPEWNREPEI